MQPIPTQSCLLCTVRVKEISGRKIFLEGDLSSVTDRTHFADSTALFINMKTPPAISASNGSMNEAFSRPVAAKSIDKWNTCPRYDVLCAALDLPGAV